MRLIFLPAVRAAQLDGVTWHCPAAYLRLVGLAMSGKNMIYHCGLVSGIAALSLVKRYAHLSPDHLRAAVESVANFPGTGTTSGTPEGETAKR